MPDPVTRRLELGGRPLVPRRGLQEPGVEVTRRDHLAVAGLGLEPLARLAGAAEGVTVSLAERGVVAVPDEDRARVPAGHVLPVLESSARERRVLRPDAGVDHTDHHALAGGLRIPAVDRLPVMGEPEELGGGVRADRGHAVGVHEPVLGHREHPRVLGEPASLRPGEVCAEPVDRDGVALTDRDRVLPGHGALLPGQETPVGASQRARPR